MIWLYRLLFLPALVLSAPYYGLRMLRRGGEVEALAPLIDLLCERAGVEIVATTTTSTGYAILRNKYAGKYFTPEFSRSILCRFPRAHGSD